MNKTFGFPLYDKLEEVLHFIDQSMMGKFLQKYKLNSGVYDENNDICIVAGLSDGTKEKFYIKREDISTLGRLENESMMYDTINSIHATTLVDYLTLSGETVDIITIDLFEDISIRNKYILYTFGQKELEKILGIKIILLRFPEGIKNKTLYNIITDYNRTGIEYREDDKCIYLMLYPTTYDKINNLISIIFKNI